MIDAVASLWAQLESTLFALVGSAWAFPALFADFVRGGATFLVVPVFDMILFAVHRFRVAITADLLTALPRPIYGYGAGLMLATLAYHLRTDLSALDCILDDQLWKPEVWDGPRSLFVWGPPPPPSFSGTSATMASGDSHEDRNRAVARVASRLFAMTDVLA